MKRLVCVVLASLMLLGTVPGCSKKEVIEEYKQRWVRIRHAPLEEARAGRQTPVIADIAGGPPGAEVTAFVFYRSKGKPFQVAEMRPLEPGKYFAAIPPQTRGAEIQYYIEARTGSDIVVRVPAKEKSEGFVVTAKGTPNRYILIAHIVAMFVALFFFIFSGYLSYRALKHRRSLLYIPRVAFLGTIAFFIASLPLGMIVAYQTFGKAWTGFPVGTDLTDTKSLIILLYWLACAVLYRGSLWRKDPSHDILPMVTLPYVHLVGAALTVIVFLIPH
jgi:hypothetical protein